MKRVKIGLRILILIAGILLIGNGVALTIRSDPWYKSYFFYTLRIKSDIT